MVPGAEIFIAGLVCLSPEPLYTLETVDDRNTERVTSVYKRELHRLPGCGIVPEPVEVTTGKTLRSFDVDGKTFEVVSVTSKETGEKLYILVDESNPPGTEI